MKRAPWHEYFMLLAKMVALRSGCNSRPSGAVIVKDKRILATGYNGPMPGAWHCIDRGPGYCFRREKGVPDIDKYNYCRATHAEANAIAQAARFGIPVEGASLYCTLAPCYVCLKLIASAGIKEVYYEYDYGSRDFERDHFWKEAIKEAGLRVFQQVKVSDEVLRQLAEILPYPTSKRRLPATEFLEEFEDGKNYGFPTLEVLFTKLRYQTREELHQLTFVIEKPSLSRRPEGEEPRFEVENRSLNFVEFEKYLGDRINSDGVFTVEGLYADMCFPLTFKREADCLRVIVNFQEIDLETFEKVLSWLDQLLFRLAASLALPIRMEIRVGALELT